MKSYESFEFKRNHLRILHFADAHGELDLMPALRGAAADVTSAFHEAIANKPENHTFADDFEIKRPMTAIGG